METATTEPTTTDPVRAWVGCLGCYNNGDLVGEWIDGAECADLVGVGLAILARDEDGHRGELCPRCGSDEFWVMDHEGLPAAVLGGECSPSHFADLAEAWELVDSPDMVAAFLNNSGESVTAENLAELAERAEESFTGYETVLDYASEWLEDSGLMAEVPETLRYYIDVEAFARDLVLGGDVSECDGYVFRNY